MMTKGAIGGLLLSSIIIPAPSVAARPESYRISVGGHELSCVSRTGKPVRFLQNPHLPDLGSAYTTADGVPVVMLNPLLLDVQNAAVATWIVEHECGHHWLPRKLNSEPRADCLAMKRTVRRIGRLEDREVAAFRKSMIGLKASSRGHLAGTARLKIVLRCAGFGERSISGVLATAALDAERFG